MLDPMNQNPSEVVRTLDADKLPVLRKDRNPRFSKETVHVIFVLGIVFVWNANVDGRWTGDRKGHSM